MYLVTRPESQAVVLIDLLEQQQIKAKSLPLMTIKYHDFELENLVNRINTYDNLLLTSPTVIDCLIPLLSKLKPELNLIVAGKSSADYLFNKSGTKASFPKHGSGVAELINNDLIRQGTSYLIAGGAPHNQQLAEYLNINKINHEFIDLYQRTNSAILNLAQTEKIICDLLNVGIIITSSSLAEYLYDCAQISHCILQTLSKIHLIALHPNITRKLNQAGFSNIIETDDASNQAIINTIRKIENERK